MRRPFAWVASLALVAIVALLPALSSAQTSCPAPTLVKPVGGSVALSWAPPSAYTDGTAIAVGVAVTYNLYNLASGTPQLLASGLTSTSSTRTSLSAGTPCYVVTAVVAGIESAYSSPFTVSVVAAANPPAGLTGK